MAQLEDQRAQAPEEKKPTRTRVASTTRSVASKPTVRKKTVKFEEPEKENIAPVTTKSKAAAQPSEPTTGLRAKPVRKAPVPAGRTTRTVKAAVLADEKYEKPIPLSPRKVTQLAMHNRATDSEDELATEEKTPVRPRAKAPPKLPLPTSSTHELKPLVKTEEKDVTISDAGILGSPCRRPPASPWKDSMKSPAKRGGDGLLGMPQSSLRIGSQSITQSPLKASLLQSPAKRPQSPIKGFDARNSSREDITIASPFKGSLMSPAKRPLSPMKPLLSSRKPSDDELGRTPVPKATLLATPLPPKDMIIEEDNKEDVVDLLRNRSENQPHESRKLHFPGRLSAVLPRHADPALKDTVLAVPEFSDEVMEHEDAAEGPEDVPADPMMLDEAMAEMEDAKFERESTTPPASPPKFSGDMFGLRDKDLGCYNDVDSESEDELASGQDTSTSPFDAVPMTPCPTSSRKMVGLGSARSSRSTAKRPRVGEKLGFTPLIQQLSGWNAGPSPLKPSFPPALATLDTTSFDNLEAEPVAAALNLQTQTMDLTMPNKFFEEAISANHVVEETQVMGSIEDLHEPLDGGVLVPEFSDIPVTEEDLALAAEANEMSMMEPDKLGELINEHEFDDALSEDSQEYGDENDIPIDPSLLPAPLGGADVPPVTPLRVIRREVHTVSKVPLKPADDSSPRPKMRPRSQSISRLPPQRPTENFNRNATVISYSPMKPQEELLEAVEPEPEPKPEPERSMRAQSAPPSSPAKSEAWWSNAGTPARTPRRVIDPGLLRGAVVFLDVHTSEGADASSIFIELLNQMGARCVKNWHWNPASPPGKDGEPSSKIGITHVVYKDGGKRTLEKVRETAGVVQCVGVGWVLE
jgi:hypothetical protein